MTINSISSNNAAAAARAQQQSSTATKHKTVDFAALMANATADIKTDANSVPTQTGQTTAIVQNGSAAKTTA